MAFTIVPILGPHGMVILKTLTKAVAAASLWEGVVGIYRSGTDSAPCDSSLYCYGQILEEIQLARPFVDSKTFVDM